MRGVLLPLPKPPCTSLPAHRLLPQVPAALVAAALQGDGAGGGGGVRAAGQPRRLHRGQRVPPGSALRMERARRAVGRLPQLVLLEHPLRAGRGASRLPACCRATQHGHGHRQHTLHACCTRLQVRAHNTNLWLDKAGSSRGARPDATILDAPWAVHLPKALLWAAGEAISAAAAVVLQHGWAPAPPSLYHPHWPPRQLTCRAPDCRHGPTIVLRPPGSSCRQWVFSCARSSLALGLDAAGLAVLFAYFALFMFYVGRGFRQLRDRDYRCAIGCRAAGVTSAALGGACCQACWTCCAGSSAWPTCPYG